MWGFLRTSPIRSFQSMGSHFPQYGVSLCAGLHCVGRGVELKSK
jgi:hypothetical protein